MSKKKPSDRIAALRAFIINQEDRLARLKTVQTIKTKIEAAGKEMEILEVAEATRMREAEIQASKVAADRKRKEDRHAKILWGAGMQLLDPTEAACIRGKILEVLSDRDRVWMMKYASEYKITLSAHKLVESSPRMENELPVSAEPIDPAAAVVMRVLKQFDPMTLSHIEGEFLSSLEGTDRNVLESLFATLGKRLSAQQA